MTPAVLLAVLAAALAAAGLLEAGASLAARRAFRRGRGGGDAGRRGRGDAGRAERPGVSGGGPGSAVAGGGGRRSALARGLAVAGRRLGAPAPPVDLGRRLDAAGVRAGVAPGDVMAVKCSAAALGLAAALPSAAALPGRLGVVVLAAAPPAAFLTPDAWLARRARRRRARVDEELADVVDLLRVAVDAGLATSRALAEVGRRHGGLLAGELRAATARAALGEPSAEALALLGRRCPTAGVHALIAALGRSERHGAPLGPALVAIAADARAQRAQAIRERAARGAPKIQLVVALLLVPSVMLLVAAALLAGMT